MTTGKTIALTRWTLVGKVMSATLKLRYLSMLEIIHCTSYLFPQEGETLREPLAFYCFYSLSLTLSKVSVTILPVTGWPWISPKSVFYKWTWQMALPCPWKFPHRGSLERKLFWEAGSLLVQSESLPIKGDFVVGEKAEGGGRKSGR